MTCEQQGCGRQRNGKFHPLFSISVDAAPVWAHWTGISSVPGSYRVPPAGDSLARRVIMARHDHRPSVFRTAGILIEARAGRTITSGMYGWDEVRGRPCAARRAEKAWGGSRLPGVAARVVDGCGVHTNRGHVEDDPRVEAWREASRVVLSPLEAIPEDIARVSSSHRELIECFRVVQA